MIIQERAKELQECISNWRRHLHQIPELGNSLPHTSKYVQDCLAEMGIPFKTMVNGSGVVGLIGNRSSGKVIGLRADMDALPVAEMTGLPYASTNGYMHACGHDAHTAVALGCARILKDMENELDGQVKLIFQPGEETLEGAKAMIAEGVLESPKVDAMLAVHMMNWKDADNGSIIILRGSELNATASSDAFLIRVQGSGGHAAMPENAIDPIPILAQIIDTLQRIISREIAPLSPAVLTIAGVQAGSDAFNVIPDNGELRGTYRTLSSDVRAHITRRLKEVSEAICIAAGATCEVDIIEGVPSLLNNAAILNIIAETYEEMEWKKELIVNDKPLMGGEDAACYFDLVPGGYFNFVTNTPVAGIYYPLHNPRYSLDDTLLYQASGLLAECMVKLMKEEHYERIS